MGEVSRFFTRPTVRVRIDLNACDEDGLVPARLSRADGLMTAGDTVVVFEPDDEVKAPATVVKIKGDFAYLRVAWDEMTDDSTVRAVEPMASSATARFHKQQTGSWSSWARVKFAVPALVGAAAAIAIGAPAATAGGLVTPHVIDVKDVSQS